MNIRMACASSTHIDSPKPTISYHPYTRAHSGPVTSFFFVFKYCVRCSPSTQLNTREKWSVHFDEGECGDKARIEEKKNDSNMFKEQGILRINLYYFNINGQTRRTRTVAQTINEIWLRELRLIYGKSNRLS